MKIELIEINILQWEHITNSLLRVSENFSVSFLDSVLNSFKVKLIRPVTPLQKSYWSNLMDVVGSK